MGLMAWVQRRLAHMATPEMSVRHRAGLPLDNYEAWQPLLRMGAKGGGYRDMRIVTAYACARILAGTVSTLPLPLRRRGADGTPVAATDSRLYSVLHDSPNADQTSVDYLEFVMLDLMFAGDHFARIERGGDGQIMALSPLDARQVQVFRSDDGARRYRWSDKSGSHDVAEREIFHIRGFGGDMDRGESIIRYGARALRRAETVDNAADKIFANGIRPSGVFEMPDGQFLSEENHEAFKARVADRYAGADRSGTPLVLEGGIRFKTTSMSNDDAQLLESRGFSVEEICRLFGVPPFMVGHSEKSTSWGTGIEQQLLGFQKFTLTPYLRRIEKAISKQLITAEDRRTMFAEFNLEGLLRSDSKARGEFYRTMTGIGAMTINEVRRLENLPPVEGGDVVRMQMQNVPVTNQPAMEN